MGSRAIFGGALAAAIAAAVLVAVLAAAAGGSGDGERFSQLTPPSIPNWPTDEMTAPTVNFNNVDIGIIDDYRGAPP